MKQQRHPKFPILPRLLAQPRAQLATFALFALLQRCPQQLTRIGQLAGPALEPAARLLQRATTAIAVAGAQHAVSGATQVVLLPDPPFSLKTGETFELVFGIIGTPEPASSWRITGDIPAGLSIVGYPNGAQPNQFGILNDLAGSISGVPSQSGDFSILLQPYKDLNGLGNTTDPIEIQLTIESVPINPAPVPPLSVSLNGAILGVSWDEPEDAGFQLMEYHPNGTWQPVTAQPIQAGAQRLVDFPLSALPHPLLLRLAPTRGEGS